MTTKSWDQMSTDEKLEALHIDVHTALDSSDSLRKLEDRIKLMDETLHILGNRVLEMRDKLQKKFPQDSF